MDHSDLGSNPASVYPGVNDINWQAIYSRVNYVNPLTTHFLNWKCYLFFLIKNKTTYAMYSVYEV